MEDLSVEPVLWRPSVNCTLIRECLNHMKEIVQALHAIDLATQRFLIDPEVKLFFRLASKGL